ncbi:uncharacterized protein J8A68_005797 [[Candida] subhashii]|uniref:TMEM205-like domain-containing protein n=1 Tax=[Candida] subhashii TaxID=561895 RepID=A0A8J5USH1_9ASCO|nr:uncharacterized protein J8A68_005797 [[Candida] subhashii]KAG7660680.1 hypothetical protein J8A68_005797 [[Candida] subhashii]
MINRLGLNTGAPYHLLFYSVAFGGSFYYSFIVSPLVFKKLTREEFSHLQNKVFPTYFVGQTLAPIILGLTSPIKTCRKGLGAVLAVSSVAGALNYFVLLPICKGIKEERNQLVEQNKDKDDKGEPTQEFTALSKKFGKYHGISSLLNLISIVSLGLYGAALAKGLSKL